MKTVRLSLAGMMIIVATAACSDSTGPTGAQISLSLATSTSAAPSAAARPVGTAVQFAPIIEDGNTLDITSVELVLREIELKRVEVVDCDVATDPDDCEKFEVGPVLYNVPLDGSIAKAVTIPIEPGTYDELEFEIHKVSSDSPDDASFRNLHPDMVNQSIRVRGTFNGVTFEFVSDLDVEQEFDLFPAITIDDLSSSTNVTIMLDIGAWFRDELGNLIDPGEANKGGQFESIVKSNITESVEAFEDKR